MDLCRSDHGQSTRSTSSFLARTIPNRALGGVIPKSVIRSGSSALILKRSDAILSATIVSSTGRFEPASAMSPLMRAR